MPMIEIGRRSDGRLSPSRSLGTPDLVLFDDDQQPIPETRGKRVARSFALDSNAAVRRQCHGMRVHGKVWVVLVS